MILGRGSDGWLLENRVSPFLHPERTVYSLAMREKGRIEGTGWYCSCLRLLEAISSQCRGAGPMLDLNCLGWVWGVDKFAYCDIHGESISVPAQLWRGRRSSIGHPVMPSRPIIRSTFPTSIKRLHRSLSKTHLLSDSGLCVRLSLVQEHTLHTLALQLSTRLPSMSLLSFEVRLAW